MNGLAISASTLTEHCCSDHKQLRRSLFSLGSTGVQRIAVAVCLMFAPLLPQSAPANETPAGIDAADPEIIPLRPLVERIPQQLLTGLLYQLDRELGRVETDRWQDRMALHVGRRLLQSAAGEMDAVDEPRRRGGIEPGVGMVMQRRWSLEVEGGRQISIRRTSTPAEGERIKISMRDGTGAYNLSRTDGSSHFTATSPDGGELFSGPVDTDEQRAALDFELGLKLEEMESMLRGGRGGAPQMEIRPLPPLPPAEPLSSPQEPAVAAKPERDLIPGLTIAPLDDDLRAGFGFDQQPDGVVIVKVAPDSFAARQDLRPGDLVVEVNRKAVGTVDEALAQKAATTGSSLLLRVKRGGNLRYVALLLD